MEKLAQDYESMFERNIAIIASRKQEVEIETVSGIFVGYLCGLDEMWVQLYGHNVEYENNFNKKNRLLLLNKENILSIITTGKDVKSISTPELQQQIEKRIFNFANISDKFIEESKKKQNEEGR